MRSWVDPAVRLWPRGRSDPSVSSWLRRVVGRADAQNKSLLILGILGVLVSSQAWMGVCAELGSGRACTNYNYSYFYWSN
jgi:hypothetical protein